MYSENPLCPITDVQVVQGAENLQPYDNENYKIVDSPVGNDYYLAFSKNATDSMPITSFVVAPGVCIDPYKKIGDRRYYPTELDRLVADCVADETLNITEDPRYNKMDLSITEY